MASANPDKPDPPVSPEMAAAMEEYGITRIPTDYFRVGEFRYTNLKDAIAQAKRQKRHR